MNKPYKRIKKYFNVSFLNAIIGVFSSALLTRIFEKSVYGKISFFSSAVSILFSLSCMGMDSAFMRFYYEPPNDESREILYKKNLLIVSAIFCLYSTILFVFRTHFLKIFDETSNVFIIAFLISVFSQIIFRYANLYFRMEEKINDYTIQTVSFQLCSKMLIALGAIVSHSFTVIITLNSILILLVALFWLYRISTDFVQKERHIILSFKGYREYIQYALIAAPNDLIFYLNTYMSQYIIKKNLSIEMVGTYSALSIFISAIAVFKIGFNNFWNPFMYKNYKTRQETIVNCHSCVIVAGTFAETMILMCNDLIFRILGGDYRTNQEILGFLILGQTLLFIQETTAYGTLLAKKNNINLCYNIGYVICRIILCTILSKKYSILGAALADAISSIFLFAISTFFGQYYYKSINNARITVVSILLICIIPIIYYNFNENKLILAFIYGVILIFVFLLNRKPIQKLYNIEVKNRKEM